MNPEEYDEMYKLEAFYWWYVARRKLVDWMLGRWHNGAPGSKILDVGCGTGMNCSTLARFGTVFSIDAAPEALAYTRRRGIDRLACCDVQHLPFGSESVDLVTALDVLEHAEDDLEALREVRRVLKPSGRVLVTVPAYGFLWSEHDEALHHRRRYVASELRNKLVLTGFEVQRLTYFITLLFFPILMLRTWNSVFRQSVRPRTSHILFPAFINSFFVRLLDLERFFLNWMNYPFGVSIVCLAARAREGDSPAAGKEETRDHATS